MEKEHLNFPAADNHLHNSGGPGSRIRTEHIKSTMEGIKTIQPVGLLEIDIPEGIIDATEWLECVAREAGFASLPEAAAAVTLPQESALTKILTKAERKEGDPVPPARPALEIIRNACILARIGNRLYDPGFPPVFTIRRLNRKIILIDLPVTDFYELD